MTSASLPLGRPVSSPSATWALLAGTALWGCSFTWAKEAGDAINQGLGVGRGGATGPIVMTAWRFVAAAGIWMALFPAARQGWTWASVGRSGVLGLIMGVATLLQVLGLDRTSEAVSAFLTSLTILFVPLLSALVFGRNPRPIMWLGIVLAMLGIWLMTYDGSGAGFGWGETLGVACAVLFSCQILTVNSLVPRDSAWRLTGGQFLFAGLVCVLACPFLKQGWAVWTPTSMMELLARPGVGMNLILLILFPGVLAFGLLMFFQPKLDASRAALIYLLEPVFAAAFAYWLKGRTLSFVALVGAGLILVANGLVEWLSARSKSGPPTELEIVGDQVAR